MRFLLALIAWLLLIELAKAGEQMPCHREPGDATWHYRTQIPPKPEWRCYYDGPRMKPRNELYWLETPALLPTSDVPPWEQWESEKWRGAAPGSDHRE